MAWECDSVKLGANASLPVPTEIPTWLVFRDKPDDRAVLRAGAHLVAVVTQAGSGRSMAEGCRMASEWFEVRQSGESSCLWTDTPHRIRSSRRTC